MLPHKLVSPSREMIEGMRAWEADSIVNVSTGFMDQGPLIIWAQMDPVNNYEVRAYAVPVGRGLFGTKYSFRIEVLEYRPGERDPGAQLFECEGQDCKKLWDDVQGYVFGEAIRRRKAKVG